MSVAQCDVCDGYIDTDEDDFELRDIDINCMNCVERENENE
jgi:hypothetical protein